MAMHRNVIGLMVAACVGLMATTAVAKDKPSATFRLSGKSVSAGGVLIELLRDRRAALAPFGVAAANRMLDALALRRLLDGYRGRPAVDIDRLARAISSFSVLAHDLADLVSEIDVNPLVCGRDIAAVDALFVAD